MNTIQAFQQIHAPFKPIQAIQRISMPGLGFQKSRNGCIRCKERRVKCDEKSPCSACAKHNILCSLGVKGDQQPNSQGRGTRKAYATRHRQKNSRLAVQPGTVQPRTFQHILPAAATSTQGSPSAAAASNDGGKLDADDDQFPYLTAFAAKLHKTPPKATWTADLALMHHFTASAWKTLPRSGSIPQIWQVIVPQIAVEYDFLMHQILAISAFHLAALHAEQHQSYWLRATYHQNEAIQLFRQQIATIDEQNCHAVFMTASLLCLSVFGSSSARVASQSCPSLDDLLAVFLLIRGMNGILKAWEGHIHKGILSGMLQLTNRDGGTPLLKSIERQLRDLNFAADDQSQGSNTHREGVDTLLEWIVHASAWADEPESRICTTWPFSLSNQFMHCLTCRDPAALKVLLIYCRILESAGDNYWYMEGWGAGVTRDIKRCQERIGT